MKNFIVYNGQGKILRVGCCQDNTFYLQAKDDEFVIEGKADAATQKVINVGVKGKVVDKTPVEIEAEKPTLRAPVSPEQQPAYITNEQWQDVLRRLDDLDKK